MCSNVSTFFNVFIFCQRESEDNAAVYGSSVGWGSAYIPTYFESINDLTTKNYERYNVSPTYEHFFDFFSDTLFYRKTFYCFTLNGPKWFRLNT